MRQRKFSTTNEPGGANRGNTIMVTPISRHGFRTGKCSDIRFSCKHHSTITWMRLCALFPTVLDPLNPYSRFLLLMCCGSSKNSDECYTNSYPSGYTQVACGSTSALATTVLTSYPGMHDIAIVVTFGGTYGGGAISPTSTKVLARRVPVL